MPRWAETIRFHDQPTVWTHERSGLRLTPEPSTGARSMCRSELLETGFSSVTAGGGLSEVVRAVGRRSLDCVAMGLGIAARRGVRAASPGPPQQPHRNSDDEDQANHDLHSQSVLRSEAAPGAHSLRTGTPVPDPARLLGATPHHLPQEPHLGVTTPM